MLTLGDERVCFLWDLREKTPENRHLETWWPRSLFEVVKRQKRVPFWANFWNWSKTQCYKALSMLIKVQAKLSCICDFCTTQTLSRVSFECRKTWKTWCVILSIFAKNAFNISIMVFHVLSCFFMYFDARNLLARAFGWCKNHKCN